MRLLMRFANIITEYCRKSRQASVTSVTTYNAGVAFLTTLERPTETLHTNWRRTALTPTAFPSLGRLTLAVRFPLGPHPSSAREKGIENLFLVSFRQQP